MSTLIAIVVATAAIGMLLAYRLGYSAGRQDGFEDGRKEGKKEGSIKAYAVGYDRGKHDRDAKSEPDESEKKHASPFGCALLLAVTSLPFIFSLTLLIGPVLRQISEFIKK